MTVREPLMGLSFFLAIRLKYLFHPPLHIVTISDTISSRRPRSLLS